MVREDVPMEKGLRFLDFFNDPRIIREQRIAAYKGYRGGGVVQVRMSYLRLWRWTPPMLATAKMDKKEGHVLCLRAKEWRYLL
ncbi:hypothetical protein Tco_1213725 [Tanacetum coccineum]